MPEALKTRSFYAFGPFRLDLTEGVLLRQGEPVSLTPKALEVLQALVSRHGRIVEKDELMTAAWPDTFVEESNLAFQISVLRKILGDGFIETIPKRGYRFKAIDERKPELAVMPAPGLETAPPAKSPSRLWIAAVAVLVTVGLAAVWIVPMFRTVRSIAILPLKAPPGLEALGLGLADALITRLGNSDQLRVRPTSAIYRFENSSLDPVLAGQQLGVDAVVTGLLQRSGDRIRATLQVIRVSDGKNLLSSQVDQAVGDLFALEDGLSQQLERALAARLSGDQRANLGKHAGTNPETHRLVLLGRYHHFRQTQASMRSSIDAYRQAIAKDDRYAPAYAGLALSYFGYSYAGGMPAHEAMPKAREAAQRAIDLDPNLSKAHAALAFVQLWYDYDLKNASISWHRALALDPRDRDAQDAQALDALVQGRLDESIAVRKEILADNPVEPFAHVQVARSLYYANRHDEALTYTRRALELDPNYALAYQTQAIVYRLQGRHEQSIEASLKQRGLSGGDPASSAALREAFTRGGIRGWDRFRLDDALERMKQGRRVPALGLAVLCLENGQHEQALDWLEKAHADRDPNVIVIKTYPPWRPLDSHPRFKAMLAKLGLNGA